MTLTVHEFPAHKTLVVMDGRKIVAKARHIANVKTWILRIYNAEWIDARAAGRNAFGGLDRQRFTVKSLREARAVMIELAG